MKHKCMQIFNSKYLHANFDISDSRLKKYLELK